jgi:hypothetical protein
MRAKDRLDGRRISLLQAITFLRSTDVILVPASIQLYHDHFSSSTFEQFGRRTKHSQNLHETLFTDALPQVRFEARSYGVYIIATFMISFIPCLARFPGTVFFNGEDFCVCSQTSLSRSIRVIHSYIRIG